MSDKKIRVYNRSNSTVFYRDEETNKLRTWNPIMNGVETYKDLTLEEIQRVLNDYGTRILFEEYLLIKDVEVCKQLELDCPKEYFYDAEKIKSILETGTDFDLVELIQNANEGIKDMIKQIAVEIKLDSSRKREIIKQRMNFDINFVVNNDIDFANTILGETKNSKKYTSLSENNKEGE